MYYVKVGKTLLGAHQQPPARDLPRLYEEFLREKGVPTPFTPKANIEEWVKRRDEFMKTLHPLTENFIKWLGETWHYEIIYVSEHIEVEP